MNADSGKVLTTDKIFQATFLFLKSHGSSIMFMCLPHILSSSAYHCGFIHHTYQTCQWTWWKKHDQGHKQCGQWWVQKTHDIRITSLTH
jgi:hypothetical protein